MDNKLLPWHQSQWQRLHASKAQGRLPHALLLNGPEGLGKHVFATQFAQSLLCDSVLETGAACGECRACQLFQAGSHPDITLVSLLEDKKNISVDQIRGIGSYVALKSTYAGYKIVIVSPAEAMNVNAANSLLKTREEPSAGTVIMLVSSRPAKLPATIRSRCQMINFGRTDEAMALTWLKQRLENTTDAELALQLANGAPLKALELSASGQISQRQTLLEALISVSEGRVDPLKSVKPWLDSGLQTSLLWLHSWMVDMARLKTVGNPPFINNPDLQSQLISLTNQVSLAGLSAYIDKLEKALRDLEGNLNPTLVIEDLLISWQQTVRLSRVSVA